MSRNGKKQFYSKSSLPKDEIDEFMGSSTSESEDLPSDGQVYRDVLDNEVLALSKSNLNVASTTSSSDDDSIDQYDANWGSRKRTYYAADYVDSEIISSDDEALEEEAAAKELQKREINRIDDEDFDTFTDIIQHQKKQKFSGKKEKEEEKLVNSLKEEINFLKEAGVSEKVQKDLSKLSKKEILEVLINDSPEILQLMESFKICIEEIQGWILPMYKSSKSNTFPITSQGKEYISTKYHLTMNYCVNVAFYLLRKSQGKSVKDHPVIDRLLKYRTLLNKLAPVDEVFDEQIGQIQEQDQSLSENASEGLHWSIFNLR
eukprot:TRINITY_DN5737_c0_g3_i1.p1 TRINITY_DN5737_c0_g3~~TRINITY_DN5737_c0_g3_i1.p1  ORF type:complete len:318 (-),score=99.53 TRINITY_DN5737_c0_g3_i1:309-1262(-)